MATTYMLKDCEKLIDDPYRCLSLVRDRRTITLPNVYIGEISKGVRHLLDEELWKYSNRLQGTVTAYRNVKILKNKARVLEDLPYLSFDIAVDYVVFSPQIGSILRGCVNKLSRDHIGCIVNDYFNASLLKSYHEHWDIHRVRIGSTVLFEVTHINQQSNAIFIIGKILEVEKGEHDDSYQPGSTVEDDGYGSAMPSTGSQSPTDKPSKHKKQQKTYFNFDEPDESEGSVELKTIHLKNDGKMKSKGGKTTDTLTFSDSDDDESDKKKNSKSKTEILRKNQKNADISTDVDDSDMIEIEAKAKKRKAKKVRTDDKIMDKELKLRENFDITTKTTSDSDSEANEKEGDKKRSVNSNSSIRNVTLKMANDDTSHGTDESEKTKSIGKKENRKYTDVSELIESHLTIGKPNKDKRKRVESDHKIKGKKLKRKSVTADALSRSDSDSSGNKSKSEEFPETEIGDATSDEMNSIDSDDSEANRKSIGKPTCKRESKNLKTESVSCDIDRVHAVAGSIEKLKTKPTKDFIKRVVKSEKQTVLNEVSAYVVCEGATKKGDKDQESKLPRGTKRKTSELLDMTPKISKKRKMADKEETSSDVNLIEDELFEYAMQTNSKKRKLDNTASINDHTDANETTSSSSKRKRQKKDDICASKSDIQNEVFEVVKESSKKSNRRKKGDILDQTQNRIPVGYSESCNVDDVLTVELPREEVKKESKKSRKERGDEGKKKKGNKKKRRDDKKKKRKDDKKKKRKDGERKKKDSGKKRRHCDKKKKDREKDSQKKKKRG